MAASILFGVTAWGTPAIMAAAAGDYSGPRLAPATLGFITFIFGVGQAIGPSLGGFLADITGSFVSAFILCLVIALAGFIGATLLRPPRVTTHK